MKFTCFENNPPQNGHWFWRFQTIVVDVSLHENSQAIVSAVIATWRFPFADQRHNGQLQVASESIGHSLGKDDVEDIWLLARCDGFLFQWQPQRQFHEKSANRCYYHSRKLVRIEISFQMILMWRVMKLPPLMVIQQDSDGVTHYSGALFEHLQWLSQRLQFKWVRSSYLLVHRYQSILGRYILQREPANMIGMEVNGSWNGLIGQLIRQVINQEKPLSSSSNRLFTGNRFGLVSTDR